MNWYNRICLVDNSHWRTAGVRLINISKIASETGDNRAAVYIDASIAESAGRLGADDLWKFANLTDQWDFYWLGVIFDGIIAALERGEVTEAELYQIWSVATEIFYITEYTSKYDSRNNMSRIYLADIKEAITLASDRLGYRDISHRMQKISPIAFAQTRRAKTEHSYIIPQRWYEDEVDKSLDDIKQLSCMAAFSILKERFECKKSDFRWDMVVFFINKLEQESGKDMLQYIPTIFDMLMQRNDAYYWEWDGANRLFKVVLKYFNE